MAGIHEDFQDMKKTHGLTVLAEVGVWVPVPNILVPGRQNVLLINTGVNRDGVTAHVLEVKLYQGDMAIGGDPDFILFTGDNFPANYTEDINIAVRSDVLNGTFTLIETENPPTRTT